MDLVNHEEPKVNKPKRIILILLITSIIAVIAIIALILYLSNEEAVLVSNKDKIFVDEIESSIAAGQIVLETNEGNKYLAIKELASLIEYNYFNGEYLKYTEDITKCYIENIIETEEMSISNIVGLEANSNMIYKTTSVSNLDYEYIEIKHEILQSNNKLYIAIDDVRSCIWSFC